jgi:hypothetical protein
MLGSAQKHKPNAPSPEGENIGAYKSLKRHGGFLIGPV